MSAILDEQKVYRIKARRDLTAADLAVAFGVKESAIRDIRLGRTWRDVPDPPASSIQKRSLANYVPVPESGCWIWLGAWNACNYGQLGPRQSHSMAHRFFYQRYVGPIPDGLLLLHKCDTPPCVNPDHLYPGTAKDNAEDMWRKGRARPGGVKKEARDV